MMQILISHGNNMILAKAVLTNSAMLLWGLVMLISTFVCGLLGLPIIRKLNLRQKVRDDGPASHFVKSGTPTFGGLFFLIPLFILGFAATIFYEGMVTNGMILLFMFLFGLVGFLDDYIKVRVTKDGLSVKQKTVLLGLLSVLASACFVFLLPNGSSFYLPFTMQKVTFNLPGQIIYFLILIPFLFYMSNSVNITDGLDGLLSGLMSVASVFIILSSLIMVRAGILNKQAQFLPILILAACLAFLFFNRHPARVFMGDTGSQALGIGFSLMTVAMGVPYLAVVTGFVFFFEGLSVVIQTTYFRITGGKRIFLMSPIHHHFEQMGWRETKVVKLFILVGILAGLLGILFIYGAI